MHTDNNNDDPWARPPQHDLPTTQVDRLLELGHHDVVKSLATRGDWSCAAAHARLLAGQGRHEQALQVVDPYLNAGRPQAVEIAVELLDQQGMVNEAVALLRARVDAGHSWALEGLARLLGRRGRSGEAYRLLRPHVATAHLAAALVDLAEDADRDEDAAELLTARIQMKSTCTSCRSTTCGHADIDPWNAIGLLAVIRERQGRVEDAISLFRMYGSDSVNGRDQLADLLARHGRLAELRAYAADDYFGTAARRLAEWLEEHGDLEGAITVYRERIDTDCVGSPEVHLAELLARHNRTNEAIAMMRARAERCRDDWSVDVLCTLYADQGDPEGGLACLDDLEARHGPGGWEILVRRLPLMVACGHHDEAIALARAHPEGDSCHAAEAIARLLADAGRTEDAIVLLEQHLPDAASELATHLIEIGRVEEAVTHLRYTRPALLLPQPPFADEPPF